LVEHLDPRLLQDVVARALAEDIGHGDLTSLTLVEPAARGRAQIIAKAPGILCGLPIGQAVFAQVDASVAWSSLSNDGEAVTPGQVLVELVGPIRAILMGERVALNFMQQLSGVSTATAAMVRVCAGARARILDTRKTVPGLRALQRYAVRVGGGVNHRFGLFDAILIKENHIAAAGGIAPALERARAAGPMVRVEIEVETLAQLDEALAAGADLILLDNMDLETMRQAVTRTGGRAKLEASGGVTLETVAAIAQTGVDFISAGSLTHSTKALDLSLRLV
jgi:nicotinate-nucleotide pyrophosphorylase (carboxylating)